MDNIVENIIRSGKFKRRIENMLVSEARMVTGLNRAELVVVYLLYRYQELNTLTSIANFLQMNKGHISTTVDRLCKEGYVISQRDKEDHRFVRYQITDKAKDLSVTMDAIWEEISKKLVSDIEKNDLEAFGRVTMQLEHNVERLLKEYGQ
ncbi:MAG: MarR family transcriptional regulator [Clostridiales bacterium]|nr:MarR family transcriptional regulator [Clostridiales bacterium]